MIEVKSVENGVTWGIPFQEAEWWVRLLLLFRASRFMPITTTSGTSMVINYKSLFGIPFYLGEYHARAT